MAALSPDGNWGTCFQLRRNQGTPDARQAALERLTWLGGLTTHPWVSGLYTILSSICGGSSSRTFAVVAFVALHTHSVHEAHLPTDLRVLVVKKYLPSPARPVATTISRGLWSLAALALVAAFGPGPSH